MCRCLRKSVGLGAILAAAVLVVGAHALTASNTGAVTKAGLGSGNISGYAVTNVQYTNSDDTITAVQFNLDAAAGAVSVRLVSTGSFSDCGGSGVSNLVSCTGLSVPAADADQLTVVATQ